MDHGEADEEAVEELSRPFGVEELLPGDVETKRRLHGGGESRNSGVGGGLQRANVRKCSVSTSPSGIRQGLPKVNISGKG